MHLDGVVLLAASTPRSQAYLQALVANGLKPDRVILFGEQTAHETRQMDAPQRFREIVLPNLTESLAVSSEQAGIATSSCATGDVNADEVADEIADASPRVVIYSGRGGQIVGERLLRLGPQFLHLHSGWLPEYRGSTTLYYALLNGEPPAVTAILLDRMIDTGPVVARRHYPRPPASLDLDRVYDAAIRADLLVRVMREYATNGSFPVVQHQTPSEGTTYYVIHPVLKHLARLSLSPEETS